MIILQETEWAKDMIRRRDIGDRPYETYTRVARYYMDIGYSKKQAREKLCEFIEKSAPRVSVVAIGSTIDSAVAYAAKFKSVNIDGIHITKKEIETINSISGVQSRRLAFTLLCLAKYWNIRNENDSFWVVSKDNDIMKMANIKTSMRRQCKLYHDLIELGLISLSKRIDSTNVRVNFADDSSNVELVVPDFADVGNRYLMHVGEPFFECAECGRIAKYSSPKYGTSQKYCERCAPRVHAQQKNESKSRLREKIVDKG